MFYAYIQNNSGGVFDVNDRVKHYVIIEAHNAKSANKKAKSIGIYFDGVAKGIDCPCYGDRWYRARATEGTKTPKLYGDDILSYFAFRKKLFYGFPPKKEAIVYYKNGKFEVISSKEINKI